MKSQTRFTFIGLIVLIALISSIALPMTAFADEAPTPPPASDSSGSAQPAQGADTSAPAQPADTSAPTEPPPATDASVPPASQADTSVATQDPATVAVTDTPAPADTTADTNSPAATDTPVVVINSTGTVEPLATQAAADIIASGDPMWCPDGVTPGGVGCSSPHYGFHSYGGDPGLLSELAGKTGPGTIWIASDYDSSTYEGGLPVVLDAGTLGTTANWALTLQGGVGGTPGSTSTFKVPLRIDWKADITLNDITFDKTSQTGLYVTTTGNISVNNVNSNNNHTGSGAALDNRTGSSSRTISVNNSTFDDNGGYAGLAVYSKGSITLTNVTANNKSVETYGAYLDNCLFDEVTGCVGTGKIEVDNSTFNSNGNNGLDASSNGDITLSGVTANDNYIDGAYLDNSRGTGSIEVDNSTFGDSSGENGNGICGFGCFSFQTGLEAYSTGDITLMGVTADGNFMDGAYLDNSYGTGSIEVDNSSFNYNGICGGDCGFFFPTNGLDAYSTGDITLTDVTANNNYYYDAYLDNTYGDGSIEVDNSTFSNTTGEVGYGYTGLEAYSNHDITLTNTDAIGNFDNGAYLETPGPVVVNCGHYNDNGGAGIEDKLSASLTLNGVELSGNAAPYLYGGIAVIGANCNGSSGGSSGRSHAASGNIIPVTGLPIHTIDVSGGEGNGLDCTQYGGTQLILPNKDSALFPCPISDSASLGSLTSDKLPGALPNGDTFGSSMTTKVIKNGASNTSLNGTITVSFSVPDNMKNDKLAILYWDGSKWVEVSGHMTPDGHFETVTNLTGTFVLVSK